LNDISEGFERPQMKLEVIDDTDGVTRIVLEGRMDIQGALAVDPQFQEIAKSKRKVLVDLTKLDFLASLGMRTLVMSAKAIRNEGGTMVLIHPQPNVEEALKTAGLDMVIPIARDADSAARHLA
jgi:anti-sigma B factor antagonist